MENMGCASWSLRLGPQPPGDVGDDGDTTAAIALGVPRLGFAMPPFCPSLKLSRTTIPRNSGGVGKAAMSSGRSNPPAPPAPAALNWLSASRTKFLTLRIGSDKMGEFKVLILDPLKVRASQQWASLASGNPCRAPSLDPCGSLHWLKPFVLLRMCARGLKHWQRHEKG
jgi:hypothetical protein